jgi:hypothetical protein
MPFVDKFSMSNISSMTQVQIFATVEVSASFAVK